MISIIQLKHCDYHRSLGIVNDTGVKATDGMGLENRCLHGLGAGMEVWGCGTNRALYPEFIKVYLHRSKVKPAMPNPDTFR